MSADRIQISLSKAEALVIFDWIADLEEESPKPITIDEAQMVALGRIHGQLQSQLVAIFAPNSELLDRAKEEILRAWRGE